ncbi:hypothetical protein Tco_0405325 [Tanacetum coccineum]
MLTTKKLNIVTSNPLVRRILDNTYSDLIINMDFGVHEIETDKCTDISKITRKPSKMGKHGHRKRKSTREAKDSKPKPEKVKLQSKKVNHSQTKVISQRTKPKTVSL